MNKIIYLDNNATTMVAPEVVEAVLPYFSEKYANPGSIHSFGRSVGKDVEDARMKVAALVGADHGYEIVFTSTGTEADNLAILGTIAYYSDKKHIITSKVEHPAVLNLCRKLEKDGYRVTYVPVDSLGNLDIEYLFDAVDRDTAIVSIMYANSETGVIFPVEKIGAFLEQKGIPFHVDAVQAAGKIPIDVNRINCDFLTVAGHKLHAPMGVAALYVRGGTRMRPVIYGGKQEKSRRPGTENVPSIVGFGKAAELALKHLDETDEIAKLRDRLQNSILKKLPNSFLNGDPDNRVPGTLNIGFKYIESEAILLNLDAQGVAASSGSACATGSSEPSHVLSAMGLAPILAHGCVRFSLSRYTTESEIDHVVSVLPGIVSKLLDISPYWDNERKQGHLE